MKKYLLHISIILTLLVSNEALSQTVPLLSEYMLNDYLYNPAMGGKNGQPIVNFGYRTQWVGFGDNASRFFYVSGNGTIHDSKHVNDLHDIGGYMFIDALGPQETRGVNVSYSFHKEIAEGMELSVGTFLGLLEYSYDPRDLTLPEGDRYDPAILSSFERKTTPDGSLGSLFYTQDFYVGLSVKQIFSGTFKYGAPEYSAINKLRKHWFLVGGYDFLISDFFMLSPSILFKGVRGSRGQMDVNLKLNYEDYAFLGVSYRTNNTMSFIAGVDVTNIGEFGYAYDVSLGSFGRTNNGSHEIIVTFRFEDFRRIANSKFKVRKPNLGH